MSHAPASGPHTFDLGALAEYTDWAKELPEEPSNPNAVATLMQLIEQAHAAVLENGIDRKDLYRWSQVMRNARDAYYTLFTRAEQGNEQSFDKLTLRCTWALNLAKHSIHTAEDAKGPRQWDPRAAIGHLNTLENRLRELQTRIPSLNALLSPLAKSTERNMRETVDHLRQAISAMDGVKRPCWAKPLTGRKLPPFKS